MQSTIMMKLKRLSDFKLKIFDPGIPDAIFDFEFRNP